MNFKGWRLQFVILTAFLSVVLLSGGHWVYRHYTQEKPLTSALMDETAAQEVEISKTATGLEIKVVLGPVDNLQQAYRQVEARVMETYSQQPVKLVIQDRRSPSLESLWLESQYIIYEAAVKGNFTQMATTIDQLAQKASLDHYAVNIDDKNIYLQFSQGQDYLYQVVPRQIYVIRGEA